MNSIRITAGCCSLAVGMVLGCADADGSWSSTARDQAPARDEAIASEALPLTANTLGPVSRGAASFGTRCMQHSDCDDANVCTDDFCDNGVCVSKPNQASCDDGDACTLVDICEEGVCGGQSDLVILDGSALPAAQGWTLYGDPTATSVVSGAVEIDTVNVAAAKPIAMHAYTLPNNVFATHDLVWKMWVTTADHNSFDASVAFLPAYSGWYGGPTERPQMVYFEETEIGWADLSASSALDTTMPHAYRFHVTPSGTGELYVDGVLRLTRPNVLLNGTIGFGDQTNDTNVDGIFAMSIVLLTPNNSCL